MKRFKFLIAGLALPLLGWAADAKQVPYSTDFSDINDWTIVNGLEGSQTWQLNSTASQYSGAGATQGLYYKYDYSNPGDDWCISPAVHLEAGKEYKMKVWKKTGSGYSTESFKIMMSADNTAESLQAGTEILNYENLSNTTWSKDAKVITVETSGDYYFGIYCYSPKNRYYIYITNFSISENIVTPAAPSGLTATADADKALKVDLAWTLPTVDDDGAELASALTGIEVYRDRALIKTLDGTATAFTDDETTGLVAGFHEYQVRALMGDAKSALTASVKTKYVGPIAAQQLPWTSDFSTQDNFDALWTVAKGESSTTTNNWSYYSYGKAAQYYPGSGKREDDWLISPPLKFEKAGAYKVSLNLKYAATKTNFEVWLGNGAKIADFTQKVGVLENLSYSAADYDMIVFVDAPGEYYLGMHANAATSSYSTYYLYSAKVAEYPLLPKQIDDLAATINGNKIDLTWTNPSQTNANTELQSITKVVILRGETEVATINNPAPGSTCAWSDENPDNGFNTYSVVAYNDNGAAEGTPITATSKWFGDPTQQLPYSYNFKSGDRELFGLYTIVDANNDGYTWVLEEASYRNGVVLKMNTEEDYSNANDLLVTPPFDMEEGYYQVKYSVSVPKNTKVTLGLVSDINDVVGTFTPQSVYTSANGYVETTTAYLHVDAASKQYVAWKIDDSFAKSDMVYIRSVDIEKTDVVPGVATDLKVTPDPDMALSATFEWKNPAGTNIDGVTTELTKAVVYRDNEEIATITEGLVPGEMTSYVDNDVPNAGIYTYSVEVYNANGKSEATAPSVDSAWIGAGVDVPYTANFYNWTIHNVNGDSNSAVGEITWTVENSSGTITQCTSSNNTPDDYIISERINFTPKHVYDFTFLTYVGYDGSAPYTWELTQGADTDYASHSQLMEVTTEQKYAYEAQTVTLSFRAVEEGDEKGADGFDGTIPAGVRCIGFHTKNKGAVYVKEFSIVENALSTVESLCKTDGYAVVDGRLTLSGTADFVIIADISGKTVLTADGTDSVDINGLATGVYIVRASVDGKAIVGKFAK